MSRLLRAFSLVVTDRRWAAPLSATALGFGIFAGVAIGPSASGTLAGAPQVIEIVEPAEQSPEPEPVEAQPGSLAEGGGGAFEGGGALEALPSTAPLAPESATPEPASPEPEREPGPAPPEEEEDAPEGTELKGVVVHANPAAGGYTLAIEGGELVPVHARELPPAGAELTVVARQLANGTFAEEEEPKRTGRASQTTFTGLVTWASLDPAVPAYTVSGRGASLLVRVPVDPTGLPFVPPAIGAYAKVTVGFDGGLLQKRIEIEPGEPSTYLDLAGIFGGVLPSGGQALLSADDTRASEADLTLTVPPGIDATKLRPGDSHLATAEVQPDGSLTLKGIASDEHRKRADDPSTAQGDLKRSTAKAAQP